MICGECILDSQIGHQRHAHTICHAPCFVAAISEELPSAGLERDIGLHDLDTFRVPEGVYNLKSQRTMLDSRQSIGKFNENE